MQVNAVGGLEVAAASEPRYVVFEGKSYLGDFGVGEEVCQGLRHAYVGEAEEVTTLFCGDLQEGGGVMHAAGETGSGLCIDTDSVLFG